MVQSYVCAYVKDRDQAQIFYDEHPISLKVAAGTWAACVLLTSLLGDKLRGSSCAYTLLFLLLMVSKGATMVFLSLSLMPGRSAMVASAMMACCCCALSFYACLFKTKFTVLWSHISFAILLSGSLCTAEAIYRDNRVFHIASAVLIALWASFVVHNLIAIHDTLKADESFYAALRVQADWTILCRKRCQGSN